jgi:glycogen(starch) synthase
MRVVFSAYGFLPDVGGVSTTVAILARAFADAGHDVTVVTLSDGPIDGYGYRVVRRPDLLALFRLYREADLLILANLALRLIYPLLFMRRDYALQHHSESAFRLGFSPADLARRLVRDRATHFMTSEYIGRQSGFARYVVTPPFPDSDLLVGGVVKPIGERKDALFVGRVEPEKGVLWFCERWDRVRRILGVDKLRIVGAGSATGTIEDKLRSGEWRNIELVGSLPRAETAREMAGASYIFVPSLWREPFGAVALEGIAAGAIAVVSDRGGLTEAGGQLAFYFDPDDDAQFHTAIEQAREAFDRQAADPGARADYMARVEQHVRRFDPARSVDKIVAEMSAAGGTTMAAGRLAS